MSFYPTIKESQILELEVVMRSIAKDPSYLNHSDCPYGPLIKDYFHKRLAGASAAGAMDTDIFDGEDDMLVMDQQIQKVLSSLDAMGAEMLKADTSDRITYFKAKTTLIEKLITMKERIFNLREIADFRNQLMTIFEQVCTKDQVTEIMQRLSGVLGLGENNSNSTGR